ncbi:hypothetical protein BGZ65_000960 [Modicella reniformis]|uniref:Uncharacterized protein n=1 Tax=Modicella reniformis TaxID=1440133 RepID=A0A9P6IM50_9FUNG|nr:hypothetical protein BGZ65_000960 [Modicella reniformis]
MTDWSNALATRANKCPVNASFVTLYVMSLQDPTKLQQMDLFRAAQPQPEHQQALEEWWTDTLTWLACHRDTTLRNLGVYLQNQTKGNNNSGHIAVFWQDVKNKKAARTAVANDNLANLKVLTDVKTGALALKMSVQDAEDLTPSQNSVSKSKKKENESNKKAIGERDDANDGQENEEDFDVEELAKEVTGSFPHAFSSVFQALYNIAHDLPVEEIKPGQPIECELQQALFTFCAKSIPSFKEMESVQQKEVYVAASSIAYLPSSSAEKIFGDDDVALLKKMMLDPKRNTPPSDVSSFLKSLKEKAARKNHTINASRLVKVVKIKLGEIASKELENKPFDDHEKTILELLEIIVPLCVPDRIPRPRKTEQMSQVIWTRLLEVLFADSHISVVIGETGLEPSKAERQKNETAHTVSVSSTPLSPRKVDIKLTVSLEKGGQWTHLPISTFEVKPKHANAKQVKIQSLKNSRLNHVAMKQHSQLRLLYLDIHGMMADLMILSEYGRVHVCSQAADRPLQLPVNESELSWFFEGHTIQALFSLRDQIFEVATKIQRNHTQPPLYKSEDLPTSSDISLKSSPSRNHTFFTPKRIRNEYQAEESSSTSKYGNKNKKKKASKAKKLE